MRAQVGLADLLRALHLHWDRGWIDTLPLEESEYQGLRYERRAGVSQEPEWASIEQLDAGAGGRGDVRRPRATSRSALRMSEIWISERVSPEVVDDGHPRGAMAADNLPTIPAEQLHRPDEPQVAYQDLVPLPRLVQALGTRLQQPRPWAVDVPALIRASVRRRWPQALPRSLRRVWPHTLVVVLDFSEELYPYRNDLHRLAKRIQAQVPKSQLQLRIVRHGPLGAWQRPSWLSKRTRDEEGQHPQHGHAYLLLSDLGLLRPSAGRAQAWQTWLDRAAHYHAPCVGLVPVAAEHVSRELAEKVCLLRWSPDSRLKPERGQPRAAAARVHTPVALHELLACLGGSLGMDPPLLRVLRQHSSAPQDASLEGRLWAHPDVRSTTIAILREEARARLHDIAGTPGAAMWSVLYQQVKLHHHHWPLHWRLVDCLQQLAANPLPRDALKDENRIVLRSLVEGIRNAEYEEELTAIAVYVLHHAPEDARPYLGAELDALAEAIGRPAGPSQRWSLIQRGEQLCIVPATSPRPSGPGVLLSHDLGKAPRGERLRIVQPQRPSMSLPLPVQGELLLPPLQHGTSIVLGGVETRLLRRRRTQGVWGWRQSDEGLVETLDLPWSKDLSFPNEGLVRGDALMTSQKGGEVRVGIDRDEYGIFLELAPLMERGRIFPPDQPLRFRYLEPATYLQGSPQAIGRNDEHPQHPVTLSQGLWLAETPCTQALWQVVMDNNPSRFTKGEDAPRRPVEQVSWDDVQTFLKALQPLLPSGCEAVLPTESQWEYACRAGTQTAYWWGDEPDESKANVDMTGQKRWEYEDGTTLVYRYPPNPWGLHDMHGNVWEWCADGRRDYVDSPERDPEGPGDGNSRVVRGGSWFNRPVGARAAYRFWWRCGIADRGIGFRFALRSPSGSEARPGGPSAARRGGADAPAAEPPRRDADDAGSPE